MTDPFDPVSDFPSPSDREAFYAQMEPRWEEVSTRLAAIRPPDWSGFEFSVEFDHDPIKRKVSLKCVMTDNVSNRRYGALPSVISDRLADIFLAHRKFNHLNELKQVSIRQIWDAEKKSWCYEREMTYLQ